MSESEPILNQENVSNAIKDDIRLTAETLLHHLLNLTDENVSYAYTKEALIPLNTIKYRSYLHSLCYRFGCRLLNYGKSLEGEEKRNVVKSSLELFSSCLDLSSTVGMLDVECCRCRGEGWGILGSGERVLEEMERVEEMLEVVIKGKEEGEGEEEESEIEAELEGNKLSLPRPRILSTIFCEDSEVEQVEIEEEESLIEYLQKSLENARRETYEKSIELAEKYVEEIKPPETMRSLRKASLKMSSLKISGEGLWRVCGDFLRGFVENMEVWRERGVTGEDLVEFLREVEDRCGRGGGGETVYDLRGYWRGGEEEENDDGTKTPTTKKTLKTKNNKSSPPPPAPSSPPSPPSPKSPTSPKSPSKPPTPFERSLDHKISSLPLRLRDHRRTTIASSICYSRSGPSSLPKLASSYNLIGQSNLDLNFHEIRLINSALKQFQRSNGIFKSLKDPLNETITLLNISKCKLRLAENIKDVDSVIRILKECYSNLEFKTVENSIVWNLISLNLAYAYFYKGVLTRRGLEVDWDLKLFNDAHQDLKKSIEIYEEIQDEKQVAAGFYQLGNLERAGWKRGMEGGWERGLRRFNEAGKFYRKRMGEEKTFVTLCLDVVELVKLVDLNCAAMWLADSAIGFEKSTEEWWRKKGGVEGFKIWRRDMDVLGEKVIEECREVLKQLCMREGGKELWRSVYAESLRGEVEVVAVLKKIGEVLRSSGVNK
ncbi:hypothetical protein TrLO_g11635 [Triparma laevis f. longispina]|uniref:Uncharacterized protein n=1 Tax=Triparma laevis f. longispina TaxID=1714387 RepID=A0A9W7CB73_9STRA|nr:hypothetical protein TrLO_g11635 [Triparma laevis f. longispina]